MAQLGRIKKHLADYLHRLEEAEKRDHRKLVKELDLFHFQDKRQAWYFGIPMVGPFIRYIEQYMRKSFSRVWLPRN